ncbi:Ca2+-dependent phosphoinositide-specific phospholipase C [Tunturiibacter gelidiferens]|uniref:Ca2+-dependent phosphoinositide-specific phospholipase C n=1 Tax=Tunturiibacter gelidiferens TaxID=3069689 RepID=UPI003D9ABB0C
MSADRSHVVKGPSEARAHLHPARDQTDRSPPQYHALPTEKFTSSTFDALDAEIRSVFSSGEIITPDQVRGRHKTLEEAVLQNQWPTLAKARGMVVFLMDQRPVGPVYLEGHDSLRGRVIFTNAVPGQTDCAFTEENDGTQETITELVRKGYLVRTRTDADTKEARTGETARRDAALASGAQLLSTDYPASEPSQWTQYSVSLPNDAIARCNPVNARTACSDAALTSANDN